MFLHASNKQFIEFIKSSKLEYCVDCVTVYHKNMKNISENNMYYLFDLAPASLDCFPFFSLSIIETKIILIQNLKCGHLCFIWSLVAVRIPWGPRVELIRQPVEFFGFACQHARDLVLCHMLSQSLMRPHPYSESQSQFLCTHFQSQSQYQY